MPLAMSLQIFSCFCIFLPKLQAPEHAGGYTDTDEKEEHFIYLLSKIITHHKYQYSQKMGGLEL